MLGSSYDTKSLIKKDRDTTTEHSGHDGFKRPGPAEIAAHAWAWRKKAARDKCVGKATELTLFWHLGIRQPSAGTADTANATLQNMGRRII